MIADILAEENRQLFISNGYKVLQIPISLVAIIKIIKVNETDEKLEVDA